MLIIFYITYKFLFFFFFVFSIFDRLLIYVNFIYFFFYFLFFIFYILQFFLNIIIRILCIIWFTSQNLISSRFVYCIFYYTNRRFIINISQTLKSFQLNIWLVSLIWWNIFIKKDQIILISICFGTMNLWI